MLLGHKIGLSSAYYRPTEEEMLEEYMKAADNLTINEENRLRRKVEKLEVEKTSYDRLAHNSCTRSEDKIITQSKVVSSLSLSDCVRTQVFYNFCCIFRFQNAIQTITCYAS